MRIVKWNDKGFQELRSSPGVRSLLDSHAARLAAAASAASGESYSWESHQSTGPKPRWRATVWPDGYQAVRREARNHTLLSVLGGSGTW